MKNECRGYIISKRFKELTMDRTIDYNYKEGQYKYNMKLKDGNFVFNEEAIHPIQLELIIRNMYESSIEQYKEFTKVSGIGNFGGLHENEIVQSSFLASLGEIVVLYATKNIPNFSNISSGNIMEKVETLLVFFPKELDILTNDQLKRAVNILDTYNFKEIKFLSVCLSSYRADNNDYLEGFPALAYLTQIKEEVIGEKNATK